MKSKKKIVIISSVLAAVIAVGAVIGVIAATSGSHGAKKDAVVIMTEPLSGLYNPYYATSGADMGVVGLTQIGMLSTNDKGEVVAGDDYDTVVKAFDSGVYNSAKDETVYTFVIKNGLKFSDGQPLTINDVFFNIYEYLDPVYTGSSTMYSIKIKGLSKYRTQQNDSDGGTSTQDSISSTATKFAIARIRTLRILYQTKGAVSGTQNSYKLDETGMKDAISKWDPTSQTGYKNAVATTAKQATMTNDDYRKQLLEDYEFALKTFKEEIETDYQAAQDSFDVDNLPYSEWKEKLNNEIFRFFLFEGSIKPVYQKVNGKDNKLKIEKFDGEDILDYYKDKAAAIKKIYDDNVVTGFDKVLSFWGTAGTLQTRFTADATDVLIHNNITGNELPYPNIEGIVSLGHSTDVASVKIGDNTYKVAHEYNADGTTKNSDEYAVLSITIDGKDPKAIYNFSFTVAPNHYYAEGGTYSDKYGANEGKSTTIIDIKNNLFGVDYGSSTFQSKVIQSLEHVEVPVGAGAFMATDINNSDKPKGENFVNSNIVYYKANPHFMFEVKAPKLQMQVVSSTNALDKLANGEVDYVTPQFTEANSNRLKDLARSGFKKLDTWQLGYGYIGINAGKVPNVYIRRAIMAAMQVSLAKQYYEDGSCRTIEWPMSMESWAYPFEDENRTKSKQNGHPYTQWNGVEAAKTAIQNYMAEAKKNPKSGDTYKIKFTIAGASITEHPTYLVFKQASEILNECGWEVEVKADSQALNKLSTGALEVWAAAWGSTIDPDMYQVYHKNSTATSTFAWGYREIKANPTDYRYETAVINELSVLIEQGRSELEQEVRKPIYEEAMKKVLDLAIELPVYQRKTLYAYNSNTIKGLREEVNPYSSPLERIWEIELV